MNYFTLFRGLIISYRLHYTLENERQLHARKSFSHVLSQYDAFTLNKNRARCFPVPLMLSCSLTCFNPSHNLGLLPPWILEVLSKELRHANCRYHNGSIWSKKVSAKNINKTQPLSQYSALVQNFFKDTPNFITSYLILHCIFWTPLFGETSIWLLRKLKNLKMTLIPLSFLSSFLLIRANAHFEFNKC